ncbi:hypothetical protein B0H34DRAFT_667001 [Crassisporium funariophilum]|nr:hypothetical protein B0H34DRAFT_667001 [Crassisporium funariophilum]
MRLHFFSVGLALFAHLASASPAANKRTLVNVRIEGKDKTIFEGFVPTRGHNITTTSGGNHHCDGTNLNANSHPGPTCTSALDDAAKLHHFSFDGAFFPAFDDYLISSIDSEANTATQFWTILLNFQFTQVGGCQQQVKLLDEVLFAFDGFSKEHILKLSGPNLAHRNQPVTLTVVDGQTGNPVAGADVNGQLSDTNGKISITFGKVGLQGVKAQKSDSVRSNNLPIVVVP